MAKTKLAAYRSKRDFAVTNEPSGEAPIRPAEYPRFVIQKHDATRLHFDLRLEIDGVFKSWAVTRGPSLDPSDKRLAVEVEDHPLEYGDFEGTIPKGQYGGGTVMIWDRGFWTPEGNSSPGAALAAGELKFLLAGDKLKGSWVLVRMKRDREGAKRNNWLLIKHRDEFSRNGAHNPGSEDRSAASGRRMAEIAGGKGLGPRPFMLARTEAADPRAVWQSRPRGARSERVEHRAAPLRAPPVAAPRRSMPTFVAPQLCRAVHRPPDGEDWVHEVKLDGYRMQLRVESGSVTLLTRKGLDWTGMFKEIAATARSLPNLIIDGEVAALNPDGLTDFTALRVALSENRTSNLVYFAFDLLHLDGVDMRELPLSERKSRLAEILQRVTASHIRFVDHVAGDGDQVLASARRLGLEGIISKQLSAPYRSGRTGAWTKSKCRPVHEVVIGGWSGSKEHLRSLIVGVYRGNGLVHVGRVGTGFDAATSRSLLQALNPLATPASPFTGKDAPRREAGVTWVEPRLVAQIEFAGWTGAGMVREAAFKGLRGDKPAKEVRAERPVDSGLIGPSTSARSLASTSLLPSTRTRASLVSGVAISNPDKPLWPSHGSEAAITKLELAEYLSVIGPRLIEHIRGRPCSIIRAPDGITNEQFFQRHAMPGMKHVELTRIAGEPKAYLRIDTIEGLVFMGQMGAVEFHPWNGQPNNPQVPGRLIFDLDPAPDVPFDRVIDAAKELRTRLEEVGLVAFCKTTGGKGLHVVTPLRASHHGLGWKEAKAFAQAVCGQMAADSPNLYLIRMTKKLRSQRIFLDYFRNDLKSTAVAPYSPRARPDAPVSAPVGWTQVRKGLDPQRFTLRTVPRLLSKGDAWEGYREAERPLQPAVERLLNCRS